MNIQKIFGVFYLGGGVALKGQQSIIAHHAAAVIGHLDELFAATFNLNFNAGGPGVEGIFQQLFQDGSRALNYLARSDLVGNVL